MELGEKLREARLEKDLAIEDIKNETKIQKRYLESIEQNDWSSIPGSFYVRAFIREYAAVVGLDGDSLLEEHANELPSTVDTQYEYVAPSRASRHASSGSSPIFKFLPKLLVVILVIAIAFGIYYGIISLFEPNSSDDESPNNNDIVTAPDEDEEENNTEEEPQEETPEEPESEETEEEPVPTLEVVSSDENQALTHYQLTNADHLNLVIESSGKSWLDVDGANQGQKETNYFSGFAETGNSPLEYSIEESQVLLNIGRAQDLTITVNGNTLEYTLVPNLDTGQYISQDILIELKTE
ncbi:helix-turn-helix domain-containing protein [Tenuibacillus multivorans]|uniref:Protein RodZ, contains Xre-like HTH and DUF4115 domains n=1 Tax=Tenuibacillus multivorans TaxID=237069 RepID=A0A1G9XUE8_9BACI|nr:helix-turn-helix domain-containing protein [Tenuibacillus multivorans]GEL75809.1 XRE family transcriptional regulator [Tenuibacillus multivorans]SDN00046.1 protein RodZ, contains Xre-like HTH and DUF4115 domains [Tenuibacillus multivorans]